MRRAILAVILLTMALLELDTGVLAIFSSSVVSAANTFTAGTLSLLIRNPAPGAKFSETVFTTWTMENMAPGDTYYNWVDLENQGSLEGSALVVHTENTVLPYDAEAADMASQMEIQECHFRNGATVDCRAVAADANENGLKDLEDLAIEPLRLPWYGSAGGVHSFSMDVRFHPSAGDAYQGHTLVTDVVFTLEQ